MARRRYLVAYDISDPTRLRRVHDAVKGFGYALQYSVFLCDLSPIEKVRMHSVLGDLIHHVEDRVAIVDLGDAASRGMECFEFMGSRPTLPRPSGPTIV